MQTTQMPRFLAVGIFVIGILALVFCTEVLDKRDTWEEGNIVNHALPKHTKECLRKSTAILRLCLLCPQECLECYQTISFIDILMCAVG